MTRQRTSLQVNLVPDQAQQSTGEKSVHMVQTGLPEKTKLIDIYKMWAAALSGRPAAHYSGDCPMSFADGKAIIIFEFDCYPTPASLDYSLLSSIGDLSAPVIAIETRERDIIFKDSATATLDFCPEEILDLTWQTQNYLYDGQAIPGQLIFTSNNILQVDKSCFGVARIRASVKVQKYRLRIELEKTDQESGETNKISLQPPVITATWQQDDGKTGTSQLQLKVPECVEFGLNLCEGEYYDTICTAMNKGVDVYYSVCDGSYLGMRKSREQWCGSSGENNLW